MRIKFQCPWCSEPLRIEADYLAEAEGRGEFNDVTVTECPECRQHIATRMEGSITVTVDRAQLRRSSFPGPATDRLDAGPDWSREDVDAWKQPEDEVA